MFTSQRLDPSAILVTGALDNQADILGSSQGPDPTPVLAQPPHIPSSAEKQGSYDASPAGGVFQMYQAGYYGDFCGPATINQRVLATPRLLPIGLRLTNTQRNIYVDVAISSWQWYDPPLVVDGVSYSHNSWQGMADFEAGDGAIYTTSASACTVAIFAYPCAASEEWSRATLAHLPGGNTVFGENFSNTPGKTNWRRMVADLTSDGNTEPGRIWALLGVNRAQSEVTGDGNLPYDSFNTENHPYRDALAMFAQLGIPLNQVSIYLGYGPKSTESSRPSGLSLGINRNGEWGQIKNLHEL